MIVVWIWLIGASLALGQAPTAAPTFRPTSIPTGSPTADGTQWPTSAPTKVKATVDNPTGQPTRQPTGQPTGQPSAQPTMGPTIEGKPTYAPTPRPTAVDKPTFSPTVAPTNPTMEPTAAPTQDPTAAPTVSPSSVPSGQPTSQPTESAEPTPDPTPEPTYQFAPSVLPSSEPSAQPSGRPSGQPTMSPSASPTPPPTLTPAPTLLMPTGAPSGQPSTRPTAGPTSSSNPTKDPTGQPSSQPSAQPTRQPTSVPSGQPTSEPTMPTPEPTPIPTTAPTVSHEPTEAPTSAEPTPVPTEPTMEPTTALPTPQPTPKPTASPTADPTNQPVHPSGTMWPTGQPSGEPTGQPTCRPSTFGERDEWYSAAPTPLFTQDNVTGTVKFDPENVNVCEDIEINIVLNTSYRMNRFGAYRINMPGITIGDCHTVTESAGYNGEGMSNEGVPLLASYPFHVRFFEGKAHNTFVGSFIIAQYGGMEELPFTTSPFEINIDRSNGLKRTCPLGGQNATWDVYRYIQSPLYNVSTDPYPTAAPTPAVPGWEPTKQPIVDSYTDTQIPTSSPTGQVNINEPAGEYQSGYVGFLKQELDYLPAQCFVYNSKLQFSPAWQQFDMTVNLTLTMGFTLFQGDVIELRLPGFSNRFGAYPINPGLVYNQSSYVNQNVESEFVDEGGWAALKNITSADVFTTPQTGGFNEMGPWAGFWYEGDNRTDYTSSYVRLIANRTFTAGVTFSITIDRCPNHLVAIKGREQDYQGFTFVVTGRDYYTNKTRPDTVDPIGDGCRAMNYCNGNGRCNYADSTCNCFDGYGTWWDKLKAVSDDFLPDCSALACPVGPAFGKLSSNVTAGLHGEIECSNAGTCDRSTGQCRCFSGFEGEACSKKSCPRPRGDPQKPICNDRGRCKPMKRLAIDAAALPLSTASVSYTAEYQNGSKSSWDANMAHGCVCDSSWPVGLTSGTTQLGEYFGNACEYRRCPSGDDPTTPTVNETDCEGISQTGGAERGTAGNLCHIECSNKGTCNHLTGICKCFDGFYGPACGTRLSDMSSATRTRDISEL